MNRWERISTVISLTNAAVLPCAKAPTCLLINVGVTLLKRRHLAHLGVQASPPLLGLVPKLRGLGSWHLAPLLKHHQPTTYIAADYDDDEFEEGR